MTRGVPLRRSRIPLSHLGIIQYLGPTLQLLVGVCILREPFELLKLIGFGLIWISILAYFIEGLYFTRKHCDST